jgi:hypothetical protein
MEAPYGIVHLACFFVSLSLSVVSLVFPLSASVITLDDSPVVSDMVHKKRNTCLKTNSQSSRNMQVWHDIKKATCETF